VMPTTRTGLPWWQDYVEPYRAERGGAGVRVEFRRGRDNYGKPWDPKAEDAENRNAGMSTCLVLWEGERKRSPDFPELVDCTCGHQHSEGLPCPICAPTCKSGVDDGAEFERKADLAAEVAAETAFAKEEDAKELPFLEEALVDYRKGENTCPGCGRTDKEVKREGWLHQGGKLSICGRCDKAGKVAPQASDEDVAARREVQDATSRKARGKKAPTVGPALSVDRFKGEATDLGFSARLNWTTRLGGPTAVEVLQVRCLTKGCEAPAEDGPGGVVFRVPLSEGRQIDRAQLQQLRDHAQQHRGAVRDARKSSRRREAARRKR
jgi:hypothetical protein